MATAFPFRLRSLSSMQTDLHRKCLLITEHLLPGVFLYNRGKSVVPQDSWGGLVGSTYEYPNL